MKNNHVTHNSNVRIITWIAGAMTLALISLLIAGSVLRMKSKSEVTTLAGVYPVQSALSGSPTLVEVPAPFVPSPIPSVQVSVVVPTEEPLPTPYSTVVPQPTQQVGQGDYGIWRYTAVRRADGSILAGVRYDSSSLDALNQYAALNVHLAEQLSSTGHDAEIYITFRNYVDPDRFRSWAQSLGLVVQRTEMRFVQRGRLGNLDGTFGLQGSPDDPMPVLQFNEGMRQLRENPDYVSFQGVYFAVATVSAQRLSQLANDPLVFLPDVTANVVRNELIDLGVQGAEQANVGIGSTTTEYNPTPFWQMEHSFGLQSFVR